MKGFTLIELIIVLAILSIVGALSVPFLQTFQVSQDAITYSNTVIQTLRRAQQQAIAGQTGTGWGVYFDNTNKQFILFRGDSFTTRDPEYDLVTSYPAGFTVATDFSDEVYFSLYSGLPSATGAVVVTSQNNQVKTVSINSLGLIELDE